MFEPRLYRNKFSSENLHFFKIVNKETDLLVGVDISADIEKIEVFSDNLIFDLRQSLEKYITVNPDFEKSFIPVDFDESAPVIAQEMIKASEIAGVGPMGAVAGAFSEMLGKALIQEFGIHEVIVENGGDIYLESNEEKLISIFAGKSPLSEKIAVKFPGDCFPVGICTSAGTVGHSFSYGEADAVMVCCKNTLLADAYATAIGNTIYNEDMIDPVINKISRIKDILSCVIIMGEKTGICGEFEVKFLQ